MAEIYTIDQLRLLRNKKAGIEPRPYRMRPVLVSRDEALAELHGMKPEIQCIEEQTKIKEADWRARVRKLFDL